VSVASTNPSSSPCMQPHAISTHTAAQLGMTHPGPGGATGARDWFSNLFKRDPSKSGGIESAPAGPYQQLATVQGSQILSSAPLGALAGSRQQLSDSSADMSGTYYRYECSGMCNRLSLYCAPSGRTQPY
jgi:hypothetical protein